MRMWSVIHVDNRARYRWWRTSAALSLALSSCILPGGGGSEQIVPDVVHAGQPATFRLVLSAVDINWVTGRFRDLKLFYRLAGDSSCAQVQPSRRFAVDHGREGYDFTIPPFPSGTRGTLEFYFTFRFDGHPNTAQGYRTVRVE